MEIGSLQVRLSENEHIGHYDFKSHYPSRQKLNYFPTQFNKLFADEQDGHMELSELLKYCEKYCVLVTLAIKDLRLKRYVTAPYLSLSKSLNTNYQLKNEKGFKGHDNGKIIDTEGIALFTLTELDLKWVLKQYDYKEIIILDVWISNRKEYPIELQRVIDEFFLIKETEEDEYFRLKIKEWLNAIYGMTATDIVRADVSFNVKEHEWKINRFKDDVEAIQKKLNKYYKSRNNFMSFQFGVWTTAHARNCLFELIEAIGYEYFIYADTDSIFFIVTKENQKVVDAYNQALIEQNVGIDTENGRVYYGTFEDEKDDIARFKFLHAKCYAIEHSDGTLSITVAGVKKDNGKDKEDKNYMTREKELGKIENLEEGFTFKECGGTSASYVYHDVSREIINGHEIELASGCIISKVTKTLSCIELYNEYDVSEE